MPPHYKTIFSSYTFPHAMVYKSQKGVKISYYNDPTGSFYKYGLIITPAWIDNHMPSKMYDEITDPFWNFNSLTVEVSERISKFIPHFTMAAIAYC